MWLISLNLYPMSDSPLTVQQRAIGAKPEHDVRHSDVMYHARRLFIGYVGARTPELAEARGVESDHVLIHAVIEEG